jgi:hypothetical protein
MSEKAEFRFRASQRALDHVIQQDEASSSYCEVCWGTWLTKTLSAGRTQAFGRVLANIRDEYHAYIAFLTHSNRMSAAPGCRCLFDWQSPDNQIRETGLGNVSARRHRLHEACSDRLIVARVGVKMPRSCEKRIPF